MKQRESQHPIATGEVRKITLTMGLPTMFSMALVAVYHIVDSIFVANIPEIGEQATTALTLAYPIQMLMISFTVGTGVGAAVLLSRCLGEGNREKASCVAGNTLLLGLILSVIFLIFGLTGSSWYIETQTSNPFVHAMGTEYLSICSTFSIGFVYFGIFEKLIQATGRTIYATIGQVSGAITNIILDPILIYGYLGFEAYGVRGAAYATVIGQVVACLLCFYFYLTRCIELDRSPRYLSLSLPLIKDIYTVGLPAIISQGLTSVMTYSLNLVLGSISETLVTAYGLFYKVQSFVFMMAYGLKDGTTPIIAFALGMKNKERVKEGLKYSLLYTTLIMLGGLILLELLVVPLANLFGLTGEVRGHYILVTQIASFGFLFAGANIAIQSGFQALGNGLNSIIVSVGRQFLFIVPVAYLFAQSAQTGGATWPIWSTFIIGELLTFVIAGVLMKKSLVMVERI